MGGLLALQDVTAAQQTANAALKRAKTSEAEAVALGKALRTLEQRVIVQQAESDSRLEGLKRQVEANAAEAKRTQRVLREAEAELAAVNSAHAAVMQQRDLVQVHLTEKSTEHSQAVEVIRTLKARHEELASREQTLASEVKALRDELNTLRKQHAQQSATLAQQEQAAESASASWHAERALLTQQLGQLAADKAALEDQLRNRHAADLDITAGRDRTVEDLRRSVANLLERDSELKAQLACNETELSSLGEALAQLQQRESSLNSQSALLQQQAQEAGAEARSLRAQLAASQQELQDAGAAHAREGKLLQEEMQEGKALLAGELEQARTEASNLRAQSAVLQREAAEAGAASARELGQVQAEAGRLRAQQASLQQEAQQGRASASQQAEQLRLQAAEAHASIASLQEQVAQLQHHNARLSEQAQQATTDAEERCAAAQGQLDLLRGSEERQVMQPQEEAEECCAALRRQIEQLQERHLREAAQLKAQALAAEEHSAALQCQVSELQDADRAQENLSEQLRRALRKLQESEAQLHEAQDRVSRVASEKKSITQHSAELEERLGSMQVCRPETPSMLPVLR